MLATEALLLLFTRDDGKAHQGIGHQDQALKAAILADLVQHEAVVLEGKQPPSIMLTPPHTQGMRDLPTLLARAMAILAERQNTRGTITVDQLIRGRWLRPREEAAASLHEAGVLNVQRSSFLGIRRTSIQWRDPNVRHDIHAQLLATLQGVAQPTAREIIALTILKAIGATKPLLAENIPGYNEREAAQRIDSLAIQFCAEAPPHLAATTRRAIEAAQVAIISGVVVENFGHT